LGEDFPQLEFHALRVHRDDAASSTVATCDDLELLSDAGAQHDSKMLGVSTGQSCMIVGKLVGDPAAAGHGNLSSGFDGRDGRRSIHGTRPTN